MEASACPYCGVFLEKAPVRKSRCPHCREIIYPRTTPDNRSKRLMTIEQADVAEKLWSRHYSISRAKADLEIVGITDDPLLAQLDLGLGDPGEIAERLLLLAIEAETDLHRLKMAHGVLVRNYLRRGNEHWREHLARAARCELLKISENPIGIDLVDIMPGRKHPICQVMGRSSMPLQSELDRPSIPNPECPGEPAEYCTCYYAVAREWFARRYPPREH